MNKDITLALIGAASLILGSIGLPKLWESISKSYVAWTNKKTGDISNLKKKVREQKREIDDLKKHLDGMVLRLEVIIPLLRKSMKDDPEALELLKHLDLNINTTPAKT